MVKKIFFFLLALIICVPLALSGCVTETGTPDVSTDSPIPGSPTSVMYALHILSNAIQAMEQINTFSLDMNLTEDDTLMTYKGTPQETSHGESTYWNSTRTVNISAAQMEMSMDSQASVIMNGEIVGYASPITYNEKFVNGYYYYQGISPPAYQNALPITTWSKTEGNAGTDAIWEKDLQILQLTDLLKSSTDVSLSGHEKVNGVDCFVLYLNSGPTAVARWVISQHQPYTSFMDGVPENKSTPDSYGRYYQGGNIKIWVAADSYQVLKTDIDVTFDVTGNSSQDYPESLLSHGNLAPTDTVIGYDYETINHFHGVSTFSKLNQPVNIEPPPDNEVQGSPTPIATALTVPDREISFKDADLEAGLRQALNKPAGSSIYLSDTIQVPAAVIYLVHLNITDLRGLENFSRLNVLWLSDNSISDLSPLGHLPLGMLQLDHNQIHDLSSLTSLTGLLVLNLANNRVSDVSSLFSIPSLQTVNLQNNPLSPDSLNKVIPQLKARGVNVKTN